MRELLWNCGVAEETIKILETWIAWIMQNAGTGGTPFVHAILDAVRQAHEGTPPASLPHPHSPLIAPVAPPAPVTMQVPGMAPVTASFGRASKGPSPGPLAHQGPPPPNVRITPAGSPSGGAHVQFSSAPGGQQYTGELQPGQQRVLITLPDGTEEPPILIDKDHRVLTPIPGAVAAGPLANPPPATAAAAAAPGTLTGAMEALKIAGQLGPKQIEAMQAIQRGEDTPLASILIALDLVQLSDGALVLSEKGRTALAVAVSRAPTPATLAPPAPEAP